MCRVPRYVSTETAAGNTLPITEADSVSDSTDGRLRLGFELDQFAQFALVSPRKVGHEHTSESTYTRDRLGLDRDQKQRTDRIDGKARL